MTQGFGSSGRTRERLSITPPPKFDVQKTLPQVALEWYEFNGLPQPDILSVLLVSSCQSLSNQVCKGDCWIFSCST